MTYDGPKKWNGKGRTFFLTLIIATILSGLLSVYAASVSLRWDPNDPTPEGYRVFARKSGQTYNYAMPDWENSSVTCTINDLENEVIYCFVVRAYEGSLQSADSEEVCYVPPGLEPGLPGGTTLSKKRVSDKPEKVYYAMLQYEILLPCYTANLFLGAVV